MEFKKELSNIDYIVLSLGIAVSLVVGIYYAYKERNKLTPYRYHRGGGKLSAFPVALSMLVTFESSIFFLGYPAEVYVHGYIFWLFNFSMLIGYSSLLWLSVPLFYRLQVTSVFEYLQMRHDSLAIRQMAMSLSFLYMTVYAGIVIFGAALALESVTSIPSVGFVLGMTAIAVIYTAMGGLKAVVATDVIQGIIMIGSIFGILIYGTIQVGGFGKVLAYNEPSGRTKLIDFDPNPLVRHTFWSLIFGGSIRCFPMSCRQPSIQRLNSTRSMSEARKVAYLSLAGFFILQILVMFEGLVAFAYFSHKGCDPLASGQINNPNQIISYTVLDMFEHIPGLSGLFLAALCSASLSTISSLLSSASAVLVEDVVKQKFPSASNRKLVYISKLIVVVCGLICAIVAIIIGRVKGPISEIAGSVLGALDAPLTAVFALSIFVRFTTRKGVVASAVVGMASAMWLSTGFNFSPGRKVTPWLPLGPTDSCFDHNKNSTQGMTNWNRTYMLIPSPTTEPTSNVTLPALNVVQDIEGIDILYSISYMYFGAIVLGVSLTAGLIVSKLTVPSSGSHDVPEYLILSPSRCRDKQDKSEETEVVVIYKEKESKVEKNNQ